MGGRQARRNRHRSKENKTWPGDCQRNSPISSEKKKSQIDPALWRGGGKLRNKVQHFSSREESAALDRVRRSRRPHYQKAKMPSAVSVSLKKGAITIRPKKVTKNNTTPHREKRGERQIPRGTNEKKGKPGKASEGKEATSPIEKKNVNASERAVSTGRTSRNAASEKKRKGGQRTQ